MVASASAIRSTSNAAVLISHLGSTATSAGSKFDQLPPMGTEAHDDQRHAIHTDSKFGNVCLDILVGVST